MHAKVYSYKDKLWDNLKPIVNFTIESFSPVAADEVLQRVDSAGDLEENELSTVGSLLFEASEEDESGSVGDSEEDEPDPRVQEEVGSRNGIFSTKICDFLKLM